MIVAVTGTPGTGKTTAVETLSTDLQTIHLNDRLDEETVTVDRDQSRDSWVVDIEQLRDEFTDLSAGVVESHLAHYLPADRVVVLRCHPTVLADRLRDRGTPPQSVQENAESEALDVILTAAVDRHGAENVYEIETTEKTPAEVATAIAAVIDGTATPQSGTVSYIEYLTEHDT